MVCYTFQEKLAIHTLSIYTYGLLHIPGKTSYTPPLKLHLWSATHAFQEKPAIHTYLRSATHSRKNQLYTALKLHLWPATHAFQEKPAIHTSQATLYG